LKRKKLLKIWIHKIGQKNLPLNINTWVFSNHFVNSVGRRFRKDEFPMLNLPILSTSATVPVKRRSPWKRCETPEDDKTSEESISSSDEDIINDESCSTELTMIDIKHMEAQIEAMKQKIMELERENNH